MPSQPAVYVTQCEDLLIASGSAGAVRTYVLTPKRFWGLGLNLAEFLCGLRIKNRTTNSGVTIKWQWSIDGKTWKTGATVITEKSANDDFTGIHNTGSEQTPFVRIIAEIRDTATAAEQTAEISAFGYYKFRV